MHACCIFEVHAPSSPPPQTRRLFSAPRFLVSPVQPQAIVRRKVGNGQARQFERRTCARVVTIVALVHIDKKVESAVKTLRPAGHSRLLPPCRAMLPVLMHAKARYGMQRHHEWAGWRTRTTDEKA